MSKTIGKPAYTYSPEEVIEFRDTDHTPYNKRSGEVESRLTTQVRAPARADWVNFNVEEETTTKTYDGKQPRTSTRAVSFTMSREQFAAIVAHVNREGRDQ